MAGKCIALLVLCLAVICRNGEAAENENALTTPEYILPCSQSDPQLDTCIKHSFNHLRPYLAAGLPELGVPPVEPLLIERLVMENSAGPVRVTAAFNNITVQGPSNYTITKVSDLQLDTYIKHSFNHLRPYLAAGLPELGVPPVEPLLIERLVMENSAGPVRVTAAFNNITVQGPSNYTITKVRSDLKKLRIDMGLVLPRIEITGRYEVSGQVLLFPVRSQGDFWAAFSDVAAIAKIFGKEIERDQIKYMMADRLLVDFKLRGARFKVRDTVNHGSVIGEAMNQFLNNNAAEIIDEMRPAAAVAIAKHFKAFLNTAFTKIPMDVWLKA